MSDPAKNIPFYRQLIADVRRAFAMLDEAGRAEVVRFIAAQQNPDGGFCDRGGRSDLYYSLFAGMMLDAAVGEEQRAESRGQRVKGDRNREREKKTSFPEFVEGNLQPATRNPQHRFKQYLTEQSSAEVPGFIEQCCLVLLQQNFKIKGYSKLKSVSAIGKSFWRERSSINLSYRSFVLFLTFDAVLPIRGLLKFFAGRILEHSVFDPDSPCAELAAKVFLQKMLKKEGRQDQELLATFACETGGFKAFRSTEQADMLSTAVSLFALKFAGADLRLLKPGCFDFIQQNYADGAFLSGDGDLTRDLEYTFYGLLALGVLGAN